MQHVIAAVAAALSISPAIASRIVGENARTLHAHVIPAQVGAFGYAAANGSDLLLTTADDRVICEMRVSAGAIDDIECERAVRTASAINSPHF